MKKYTTILLLAICLVGCKIKNDPGKRFFFVSYQMPRGFGSWFVQSDTLPSIKELERTAYEFRHCEIGGSPEDYVIMSLHEFKDSVEYNSFKSDYTKPVDFCIDTINDKQ